MISYVQFIVNGATYKWVGWFGCQLESIEKKTLPAGTTRKLEVDYKTFEMKIFITKRIGLRKVRTAWGLSNRGSIDEHNVRIRELRDALRRLI